MRPSPASGPSSSTTASTSTTSTGAPRTRSRPIWRPSPAPRIGYFGNLDDYRVDMDLIERLAREIPEAQLVLIGEAHLLDGALRRSGQRALAGGHGPTRRSPHTAPASTWGSCPTCATSGSATATRSSSKEYLALGLPGGVHRGARGRAGTRMVISIGRRSRRLRGQGAIRPSRRSARSTRGPSGGGGRPRRGTTAPTSSCAWPSRVGSSHVRHRGHPSLRRAAGQRTAPAPHGRPARPPRARRRRLLGGRQRRVRAPPPLDHRRGQLRPADGVRRRAAPHHLQRRDLQLPRAAGDLLLPLSDRRRHRGDPGAAPTRRSAGGRAAPRPVRVRPLRRGRPVALSGSAGDPAPVLLPGRRPIRLRLRDQGPAPGPAPFTGGGHGQPGLLPGPPSGPGPVHAVQGRAEAPARPPTPGGT